eukprot:13451102-Alexandrium_andersonii.AAC.1
MGARAWASMRAVRYHLFVPNQAIHQTCAGQATPSTSCRTICHAPRTPCGQLSPPAMPRIPRLLPSTAWA